MENTERNFYVVKSNDLILHGYSDLSLQQMKILAYIISHISPKDKEFKTSKFEIVKFCRACGMRLGGKTYDDIRIQMKRLTGYDSSIQIINEDSEKTCRWLNSSSFEKGVITFRIDDSMKPYLLSQTKNFTKYELVYVLAFQSKYTLKLFELLKCVRYRELEDYSWCIGLDDFRKLMSAEQYSKYQALKDRVLNPAVNEINKKSEMSVSFSPMYRGQRVVSITFRISTKDLLSRTVIRSDIENLLDN